jgi:hypothetical protein
LSFTIEKEDIATLRQIGIDVLPEDRNYWFIRTQKGTYYEDFINEGFIGIEWDAISDKDYIITNDESALKADVIKFYPDNDRPGYVAAQIKKFAQGLKKGDIVLIPSEGSKWISFGEIADDQMYIYEEDEEDYQRMIDVFFAELDSKEEKAILRKRRSVNWIKHVKRTDLDPYLYSIIYSHNTIVDANTYSLFIDRMLSAFYIKGDSAYFTYKVNKKRNIPYGDLLRLLNNNNKIIDFINKYSESIQINPDDIIIKINVQSKGPIQLQGAITFVLVFGLIAGCIFGTEMNFEYAGFKFGFKTAGLCNLITTIDQVLSKDDMKEDELKKLIQELKSDKEKLDLVLPEVRTELANKQLEEIKGSSVSDKVEEAGRIK